MPCSAPRHLPSEQYEASSNQTGMRNRGQTENAVGAGERLPLIIAKTLQLFLQILKHATFTLRQNSVYADLHGNKLLSKNSLQGRANFFYEN
jgi:hypothetical protein